MDLDSLCFEWEEGAQSEVSSLLVYSQCLPALRHTSLHASSLGAGTTFPGSPNVPVDASGM